MRMFDATLDLARYAQGVETHTISAVSSTYDKFACASLSAKLGEYTHGGTCWILSGDSEGKFREINNAHDNTIQVYERFEDGLNVGDRVALSWFHYFNTQNLINAINHVLYDYPILDIFETTIEEPVEEEVEEPMKYHHNVFEYKLPEDVTIDIRRVEIQSKNFHFPIPSHLPDTFTTCHYWHLNGRTLVIDPHWIYRWGGRMRIYYVRDHGAIIDPETELISEQVDRTYLRKMANLWLWSHEIQMKHKDNPIAVDMFNQAKMDEDALAKKNNPESNLMPKDITYFW